MMAARNSHLDLVGFLLANGANVNLKSADGSTALSLAKEAGDEKVVQLLIAGHRPLYRFIIVEKTRIR